jgi:hypothetical protein
MKKRLPTMPGDPCSFKNRKGKRSSWWGKRNDFRIGKVAGTGGVTVATQEAEIRRISVRNQPGQIVLETLS